MSIRMLIISCVFLFTYSAVEAGPNCKCRFNGTMFKLGEIACIRGELSKCEMNLNNTSWKKIANECPQAQLDVPQQTPKSQMSAISGPAQVASNSQIHAN